MTTASVALTNTRGTIAGSIETNSTQTISTDSLIGKTTSAMIGNYTGNVVYPYEGIFEVILLLVLLQVFIGILLLFVHLFINVEAVDCVWGEYGEWSTCSATCGGGTKTRTRREASPASTGGALCTGSVTETESCNPDACPGRKILIDVPKEF